MKVQKFPVIVISVTVLTYVLFFQNCTSNTNFNTASETTAVVNDPIPEDPVDLGNKPLLDLKIAHVNGNREFFVTTQGLSVTDSQCKLQFKKNGTTWTDFGNDFLCNSDFANIKFVLPGDDWTNNFNAASGGVQVRIVKASTKAEVGAFSQKLNCTINAVAVAETPLVDENCNRKWDDFVNGTTQPHPYQTTIQPRISS